MRITDPAASTAILPERLDTNETHGVPALDTLRLLSLSHHTVPLEVLDRVALAPSEARTLLRILKESGIEAAVLATCNRVELYWCARRADDDSFVERALGRMWTDPRADWSAHALRLSGNAAAGHFFRVAAGLESLVVGESEILGQIRSALELALSESAAGNVLEELFRAALRFGGRARSATAIGTGALSTASAAVQTLRRSAPDLASLTAVVLGAGHTGFKAAQHLRSEGIGRLIVVNRTVARAREAAETLNADYASMDELDTALASADVLFVAVQVPAPCVTPELIQPELARRPRALTIIDLSMPRAVAAAVEAIPGVTLVDLSRLEEVVGRGRQAREREIPRVEALLAPALEELEHDMAEAAARPLVAEMRVRAERIRRAEVERAVAAGLADEEVLEHVTRRVVDRMLSAPSAALREVRRSPRHGTARCLECVFGVNERQARASS